MTDTTISAKDNRLNAVNTQPGAMDSLVFGRLMGSDFGRLTMGIGLSIAGVTGEREIMYERQNFVKKQKLRADQMNRIEDGLALYTELAKYNRKGTPYPPLVRVMCHGLKVGENYAVHLYTATRRRGLRQDPWRHPSNENTGEGYTGKGYANLAGQKYASNENNGVYPDVPDWMPNSGILQTEWDITAAKETEVLEIDLSTWLLPMLKPMDADFGLDSYRLIGVSNSCIAPLLFQFCVVKDGVVGPCRNTLRVGLAKERDEDGSWTPCVIAGVAVKETPSIEGQYLYTSIK